MSELQEGFALIDFLLYFATLPLETQLQSAVQRNPPLCDVADEILFIPYSIMCSESALSRNPLILNPLKGDL